LISSVTFRNKTPVPRRPLSITLIGWLFILTGVIAFTAGLLPPAQRVAEFKAHFWELSVAQVVRLLAIVAGLMLLRGRNWARGLAVAWLAFHVGLSLFHPPMELMIHSLLFIILTYFLFRPSAKRFFGHPPTARDEPTSIDAPVG
jgi:hypothetical protein